MQQDRDSFDSPYRPSWIGRGSLTVSVCFRWIGRFVLLLALAGASLAGCRHAPPPTEAPPVKKPARVALVLGGGASRGFAHVGVIRVLEQEKIPIDLIVGTSVGSLIGAIYAAERNSFELEWTAFKLEREDIFDFTLTEARMGPVVGKRLEDFVKNRVKIQNLEDLPLPFFPVATDLNTGETVVLERGPLGRAVRASAAIPGVFHPVKFAGRTLVDGGVTNNLPVDIARQRGADRVIAVSISKNIHNPAISNAVEVILQAIDIMGHELVKEKKRQADVLITPEVGDVGMMDFSQKKRCLQAGIQAAQRAIPQIKRFLASPS